jgi:hypothetical protein
MADSEQFIGSREPAKNNYGQNGDPNASSVLPGKKAPPISGNVAPPDVSANAGDWQTRDLNVKSAAKENQVPTHSAMALRGTGSPSGPVPASTIRRDSGKKLLK